jgi:hypothetical protein
MVSAAPLTFKVTSLESRGPVKDSPGQGGGDDGGSHASVRACARACVFGCVVLLLSGTSNARPPSALARGL